MPSYVDAKYWKLRDECFSDLGINPTRDEAVTSEISSILEHNGFRQHLPEFPKQESTMIFGPASYALSNVFSKGLKIVADSGISRYLRVLGIPDIIVTDLDGPVDDLLFCQKKGTYLFVHIHGDNSKRVKEAIPSLGENTVFTCQTRETHNFFDFGGFTDGDRAAFLGNYYGAESITLYGFKFDNPVPKLNGNQALKLKKLGWAWRFIKQLALDRGHEIAPGEIISF